MDTAARNEEFSMFHLDYNISTIMEQAEHLNQWTESLSDKRTKGLWMVNSVCTTFIITISYLLVVWLTPRYMKNHAPFSLRHILIVYNFTMILVKVFIIAELLLMAVRLDYSWTCQPITFLDTYSDAEQRIAVAIWLYYLTKFFELLDTVFFMLRKKDNQLSFLHVYHHTTMFIFSWIATKYYPGGSTFQPALINSCVHVLMYIYYGLAALRFTRILKYKKYITIIQLAQFFLGIPLGLNAIKSNCNWPSWMKYMFITYITSLIILFGNFYTKNYTKKIKNEQ